MVRLDLNFTIGQIVVKLIAVPDEYRRQGHASRAIAQLEKLADMNRVDLIIENVLSPHIAVICMKRGYKKYADTLSASFIYKPAPFPPLAAVPSHSRRKQVGGRKYPLPH